MTRDDTIVHPSCTCHQPAIKPQRMMHTTHLFLLFLPVVSSLSATSSIASVGTLVQPNHVPSRRIIISKPPRTILNAYGKGSVIWPECNEEPISLSTSFPDGIIPEAALNLLSDSSNDVLSSTNHLTSSTFTKEAPSTPSITKTTGIKRRTIKRTLSHLLRSAARASSRRASSDDDTNVIDKSPALLALCLLAFHCVGRKQVLSVLLSSLYLIGVASWCAAPKIGPGDVDAAMENYNVNMPSLPFKGHVPNLVANPLGALTYSRLYRVWLRLGAFLSLLLPMMALLSMGLGNAYRRGLGGMFSFNVRDAFNCAALSEPLLEVGKKLLGGHVFLICCQALTEAVARAALLPLPIRVLIPVMYNILRLSSLHDWAFYPTVLAGEMVLPTPLRLLGVTNLLYWYANLLLFLPVAVLRYLRAHFYCVEAVEVTVRKGSECSVGLLP
ncbi:hypothetical protein HJC23_004041 [Cyclotella cryptica]|uniref:DUF7733 domain-containing protein n=1 Tax=Cyclotella cryptica TaxID=29204 RepID=A0ABD3QVF7_9STRA